jgi:hypothetical protein
MAEKIEKTWEIKLHDQRQLKKKSAGMLFDRVALLIACYDDAEFRAWHEQQGTNELDFLDEELSDTAVGFLTFRAVMNSYPKRDEWIKHNVRELIALTIAAENEKKKRDGDEKRVSWKERALAAEAECERLRAELANMKESLGIVASAKCQ